MTVTAVTQNEQPWPIGEALPAVAHGELALGQLLGFTPSFPPPLPVRFWYPASVQVAFSASVH